MWNNSPHFHSPSPPYQQPQQQQQQQQQSFPAANAYNHRQSTMTVSDQLSISSGTTAGNAPLHHPHQSYIPIPNNPSRYPQQPYNANSYTVSHFYPSSHIHNAPPNPLGLNPPYYPSPPMMQDPAPPPPPPPPPSLTSILLNSAPQSFATATQHPFLRHAGQGTLPKHLLSRWLSQDRLYAQAYIGFIGALIARVDLPYVHIPDSDKSSSLRWRIVNCLTGALSNIHTELKFFEDTATKYGLELDAPSRADGIFSAEPATKQYIDLFRAFWTDPSMSLLEGMVVLWATEIVYLSAWTYASSFLNAPLPPSTQTARSSSVLPGNTHGHGHGHITASSSVSMSGTAVSEARKSRAISALSDSGLSQADTHVHSQTASSPTSPPNTTTTGTGTAIDPSLPSPAPTSAPNPSQPAPSSTYSTDLDNGAVRSAFLPNWTSRAFETFVAEIAELTDQLAAREDAAQNKLDVYKAVWRHVLDVERRFWPDVGTASGILDDRVAAFERLRLGEDVEVDDGSAK